MRRHSFAATCLVVTGIALLSGCSSSSPSGNSSAPTMSSADATTLAANLKVGIPEIAEVVTLTETNDSNHLLGRPNGYMSAAVLVDSRLPPQTDPGRDSGATIEVFADHDAAQRRADYIQAIAKNSPVLANEWDYVSGNALLRVSGQLPPSVNTVYKAAWDDLRPGG